jgi:RND superfamily putative drug exporter
LIFAASMIGLQFSSITTLVQIGFIIATGILLDTFVVRTVVIPALFTLIGPAIWWPAFHAKDIERGGEVPGVLNPAGDPQTPRPAPGTAR